MPIGKDFNWRKFQEEVRGLYMVFYQKNFSQRRPAKILWECDFPEDKLQELEQLFKRFDSNEYEEKITNSFFIKNELPFLEAASTIT